MKKLVSALLLAVLTTASHAQVVLQNFSAVVNANTFFYGTWESTGDAGGSVNPAGTFSQGSGVYTIDGAGVTNSDTSLIEFFNTSPVSIGTNGFLEITATRLSTNATAASSFQVTLVDTGGKTAFSTFTTALFAVDTPTTVTSAITANSGFTATAIDSIQISGALPNGTARFSFTFDTLSAVASAAVPEPSTYAQIALGLGALGFIAYRRRKVA